MAQRSGSKSVMCLKVTWWLPDKRHQLDIWGLQGLLLELVGITSPTSPESLTIIPAILGQVL